MSTIIPSIAVSLGILSVATGPLAAGVSPVEPSQRLVALPASDVVDPLSDRPLLQIENLRLDNPPSEVAEPATLLKFDVLNDTSLNLTDVLVRVSFLESQGLTAAGVPARVLVGPVTVRVKAILQAESVLSYEILFRNLSSDCDCSPSVVILSARVLPD